MTQRLLTALTTALLLTVAAPRPSTAQQTFQACYVPDVGAMYLIGLEGLPTGCLDATHVEISWTADQTGVTDHGNLTGLADDDHPAYVREGEAAGGDLAGTFPTPSVAGLQGNAVATTAPSDGQVLTWNATGTAWEPQTAPTGVTDHGNLSGLADDDHPQYLLTDGVRAATDGFAVTGSLATGLIPTEGAGVRLMWYPSEAAFRAGDVNGTQWDDAAIGRYSVAFGHDTEASGLFGVATGTNTTAAGAGSVAMGAGSLADGIRAVAIGEDATATDNYATALGYQTTASSLASVAVGRSTTASGSRSTATGDGTVASGVYSTAAGNSTTAQAQASFVVGRYNVVEGSTTDWIDTDPLFVAGNGLSSSPSNALRLAKNGNLTIAGTLTESSDRRLKTGIEPLGPTLDALHSIRPVRFRFREGTGHPTDAQIGLVAQEVAEAFPELVDVDPQGYLSVAYPKLTAVLLRGLQEQQARIEAQQTRIEELEARLHRLETVLRDLASEPER